MIWIVIIIAIVAVYLYNFFTDREKMLRKEVDNKGGMKYKYKTLIDYFLRNIDHSIIKEVARDSIEIIGYNQIIGSNVSIVQGYNEIIILIRLDHKYRGLIKKDLKYREGCPQEIIIKDIEKFMTTLLTELY